MAADDLDAAIATRRSLHAVAEHVLGAALHAATGRIGLRRTPGGFGTPSFESPQGPRTLRVLGTELVIGDDGGDRRTRLTTVGDAAAFCGIEPGAPADVYRPATPLDPDAPLHVDVLAARRIADWFELADDALGRLRDELGHEAPAVVQLWPEHFDLATTISQVNYGGSPGDDAHVEPYLYVGPFDPPAPDGGFWNESFGASRTAAEVPGPDEALAFFREGRARLRDAARAPGTA
jgi:hypothetical protein